MLRSVLATVALVMAGPPAWSQVVPGYERHTPLSQWQTPGTAAGMAQMAGRANSQWFQPLRVVLEDGGDISVFHSLPATPFKQRSPAQFGVLVGHLYRLKIEAIPGLPGVTLYPTLEIIDRLHPPQGQKHNFPVLIHLDRQDIDQALIGNLVTRVVYLEQPTIAAPFELDVSTRTRNLNRMDNALLEADRYGRPMVIVRLGGRLPSSHGESQRFWGTGSPVSRSTPAAGAIGAGQSEPQVIHEVRPQVPRHMAFSGRSGRSANLPNSRPAVPAAGSSPLLRQGVTPVSRRRGMPAEKEFQDRATPRREAGQR
ncbi:MAG: hypothetical protein VB858_19395 [Planctomycetaceae bacterium]